MRTALVVSALSLCASGVVAQTSAPAASPSPDPSLGFSDWLEEKIKTTVAARRQAATPADAELRKRFSMRSTTKQSEAPAASGASGSLVDQSSFADLVGVGIDASRLALGRDEAPDSGAATVTAYAIYAALNGHDPLDPETYNKHAGWRRLSGSLAFTKGKPATDATPATQDSYTLGAKWLIVDRRDLSSRSPEEWNRVIAALAAGASAGADITSRLQNELYRRHRRALGLPEVVTNKDLLDFIERLETPTGFQEIRDALSEEDLALVHRMIDESVPPFVFQETVIAAQLEALRRAPQWSVAYAHKRETEGPKEHTFSTAFDYGIARRLNLTANAAWVITQPLAGERVHAGKLAGQLQLQLFREGLASLKKPATLSTAVEGNWKDGEDPQLQAQLKLTVPLKPGVDIPFSITVANRTELIKERDVRGQIGFTVDVARLLEAARP